MSATSNTGRSKKPARLVTREIALGDVTDALERMTRFDQVGFEVITRFTEVCTRRTAPSTSVQRRA
jgi:hypothetical protein